MKSGRSDGPKILAERERQQDGSEAGYLLPQELALHILKNETQKKKEKKEKKKMPDDTLLSALPSWCLNLQMVSPSKVKTLITLRAYGIGNGREGGVL
jgi:hypothetical protein